MAELQITTMPFTFISISRSNALLAPAANSVFLSILPTDLPGGYYKFDTTVGLAPNLGSGNGSLADTRNFRISIDGFPDFIPQAMLNTAVYSTGWVSLDGSQGITLKTGPVAASASMIYSISVFLTKVA
jgi:hypothetical protein